MIRRLAASLIVLGLASGCAGQGGATTASERPSTGHSARGGSSTSHGAAPRPAGMGTVRESELPAEARTTLGRIRSGGPFPYDRDGVTFGNYERALPQKPRAYYREYTVTTPGVSSRGARRIIVGKGQEKYYTSDHYASYRFIEEGQ